MDGGFHISIKEHNPQVLPTSICLLREGHKKGRMRMICGGINEGTHKVLLLLPLLLLLLLLLLLVVVVVVVVVLGLSQLH